MLIILVSVALSLMTQTASALTTHVVGSAGHSLWTRPAMESAAAAEAASENAKEPDGRPDFEVSFGGERIPFLTMAAFTLPDESVTIEVSTPAPGFRLQSEGAAESLGDGRWSWKAPSTPGVYPVRVQAPDGGDPITVNVFVMVPYSEMKAGRLDGYRIGTYPNRRPSQSSQYERPRGFVRVTAENQNTLVAPHFRLGQFVCKEGSGFPKYVVLRPELLTKLERLLEVAQAQGVEASTFQLMSAYRTPGYNKGIGNVTTFSRHQYGDAADIFVDQHPADGRMDDLNGDGRQTRADAELLSRWAEQLDRDPATEDLVGGLSAYGPTSSHGPFVHVDTRGHAARW